MEDNTNCKYVLGQKITLHPTEGDYDLVVCESPPGAKGPPPHSHNKFHEAFLIIEGEMQFYVDGTTTICKAGESVDVPQGTIHTFNNISDQPCRWVNIHSPKGFSKFFDAFGIPFHENDSFSKSIHPDVIQKVLATEEDFDITYHLDLKVE